MVEWRLDCENCRHLTDVGLHVPAPFSALKTAQSRKHTQIQFWRQHSPGNTHRFSVEDSTVQETLTDSVLKTAQSRKHTQIQCWRQHSPGNTHRFSAEDSTVQETHTDSVLKTAQASKPKHHHIQCWRQHSPTVTLCQAYSVSVILKSSQMKVQIWNEY